MVHVAREIGCLFACERLILTGNRNRVAASGKSLRRAAGDADRLWRQLRAARRDDGDFELPCLAAAADALLPSRQRALVAFICAMVRSRFAAEQPCPPQEAGRASYPHIDRRQHHAPPPSAQ